MSPYSDTRLAPEVKARQKRQQKRRRAVAPQVKMVISREAQIYLDAVAKRTSLPRNVAVDRLILEAQTLERRVTDLGYSNVGELLAVFRELKGMR